MPADIADFTPTSNEESANSFERRYQASKWLLEIFSKISVPANPETRD